MKAQPAMLKEKGRNLSSHYLNRRSFFLMFILCQKMNAESFKWVVYACKVVHKFHYTH